MIVDCHFHLEEGPYSLDWLKRTAKALEELEREAGGFTQPDHTLAWMDELRAKLLKRLEQGGFSSEWLGYYLRRGKQLGIQRFGIVDHLYRFEEFRPYYEKHMTLDDSKLGRMQQNWLDRVCIGSIELFIELVRGAQREGHRIALGIEADYFPGGEEELRSLIANYEFDYIIGSVHFLDGWGFDNPQLQYKFKEQDLVQLYRRLFDCVLGAIGSGMFDIIAHPDNLKVFNYRPEEALLLPMYEEVAAAMKAADVSTEINTGLAYRYPVKEMCPSPAFLRIIHKHGVPVTLSSDSHFPDDIGTMLGEAAELAIRTGYEEVVYFDRGERKNMKLKG
ncbi:histidinol phosphatase [Paenibacillus darwinianus]|uniref:Histidinol-phosphatase n=1 Tax=Paenibacillus darwinianus TaxID=1380763 RepID=A0A9W5RYX7_9BACL|nr:PHP domain-containing protein [Paenibacillus darwinianus]EXX84959.1 histidinol phosphatase [Paenibacillus darwinianus]EXX84994.1 histidinol phosphatase [Paenibacillus darwinianus]